MTAVCCHTCSLSHSHVNRWAWAFNQSSETDHMWQPLQVDSGPSSLTSHSGSTCIYFSFMPIFLSAALLMEAVICELSKSSHFPASFLYFLSLSMSSMEIICEKPERILNINVIIILILKTLCWLSSTIIDCKVNNKTLHLPPGPWRMSPSASSPSSSQI